MLCERPVFFNDSHSLSGKPIAVAANGRSSERLASKTGGGLDGRDWLRQIHRAEPCMRLGRHAFRTLGKMRLHGRM